jgi:hypothetical protein
MTAVLIWQEKRANSLKTTMEFAQVRTCEQKSA